MFISKKTSQNLYNKRVDDEIVIYEIPDTISEKDMEMDAINNILNDLERNNYKAIVIDGSERIKRRLKCYIPLAKDERYRKGKDYEDFEEDYRFRMRLGFGVYSFINYSLGYYISKNILNLENPLLGSIILGTSSLVALATCFTFEKHSVERKKEKIKSEEEIIKMIECALEM